MCPVFLVLIVISVALDLWAVFGLPHAERFTLLVSQFLVMFPDFWGRLGLFPAPNVVRSNHDISRDFSQGPPSGWMFSPTQLPRLLTYPNFFDESFAARLSNQRKVRTFPGISILHGRETSLVRMKGASRRLGF